MKVKILILFSAILIAIGNVKFINGQEIYFETIAKGGLSNHNARKEYVIKDDGNWSKIWYQCNANIRTIPEKPKIDFNEEMILAVFQGQFPTGGYKIEITKVIERKGYIVVTVEERTPKTGGGGPLMILTQPYHIVRMKRSNKDVVFERKNPMPND